MIGLICLSPFFLYIFLIRYWTIHPSDFMEKKILAIAAVAVVIIAGAAAAVVLTDDDGSSDSKKGFYSWDPTVVEVNGDYSNCTPYFMTIAETVYEKVYGDVPEYSGIARSDIPSEYLYSYDSYVTASTEDTITVKTFDNTSTGTSSAYLEKTVNSSPVKVICYTDAYIDTIYMILCNKYGETAHSGNTPQADEALWDLIPAMTSSVKSGLESKFGLTVPASVTILGTGQEDLVNYCSEHSDTQTIVFMSEYNIRATNKNSWWDNCQAIESNTSGNIQFIFTLSNSPAMVLSTIEMIGKVIGSDNTDAMMPSILAEIYVMQKAIDGSGKEISFYCETASGNSVGSNTLMGGIFSSILKMENVFDGSLMGSKMSDEQIISAEPDVIGFYTSDTRSMDEKMRAA